MKTYGRKWFTRWVAACIAVVLGMGMCAGLPVSATQSRKQNFSTNYTLTGNGATDILNVALAQQGKTGSQLGYTEEWCADFVSDCADLAGQSDAVPRYGGVDGLKTRILNAGGVEVSSPQPGDIVFFSGHVEIVYSGSGSSLKSIGGNTSSAGNLYARKVSSPRVHGGSYTVVRPNYKGINPDPNPPTNLSITSNDGKYKVGDTVTFTFSCSNATEMYIPIDVNGERKYFIDVSGRTSYTCSFDTPGVYGYFLYAKNAAGEASTVLDYKQFRVDSSAPANLTISTDKNSYAVGEQITFSFSCDNAVRVAIPIDYNGNRTDFIDVTGKNTYTCSFDKAGTYGYFLYAENACGESTTEYIEFTVQDNPPSNLSISTDKSYYVIGETITFSFTSQNATRLAIPLDYNGKRVDFIDVTGKDTYTCSFDKAGVYGYFLYAENAYGESSTVLDYQQIHVYDTIPGDLNSDNTLTTADAVLLQRYILGEKSLTQSQWQAADLNADGVVNGFDLALLRQKLTARA